MNTNFVKEYLEREKLWIQRCDQFKSKPFSTITFQQQGFNSGISAFEEIHKFGGGQHFLKTETLKDILGKLSIEEVSLLQNIAESFGTMDAEYREHIGVEKTEEISSLLCITSLLRSIFSLRVLKELRPNPNEKRKPSVLLKKLNVPESDSAAVTQKPPP